MTQALQLDAAWYYKIGTDLYRRNYYLDAQIMLNHACRLAPDNEEYAAACEHLSVLATSLGGWFSKKPTDPSGNLGNTFWSNCCECCGEACCEGCCEGGCEICAEGCGNCDCS